MKRRTRAGGLSVLPGEQRGPVESEHYLGHQLVARWAADSALVILEPSLEAGLRQGHINPPDRCSAATGRRCLWITPAVSVLGRRLITGQQVADEATGDHTAELNLFRPVAVGEEEITMRVPTVVWKVMRHLVAVLASTLLFLVFLAVLPLGLGSVTLLGVIVMVGLLAGGVCEGLAVRLITRSGAATVAELQVLRTVPQLECSRVLVCRRPASAATPVVIVGRYTVVSAVLVEALQRGWVSTQEVTALVVHARAHHRVAGTRRGEVAIAVMETPWRLVVGVFSLGRARVRVDAAWAPWRGGCVVWWRWFAWFSRWPRAVPGPGCWVPG